MDLIFRTKDSKRNGFLEFCKARGLRSVGAIEFRSYADEYAKIRRFAKAVDRKIAPRR